VDEFVRNLQSANWWIGVFVVGIALNLLSAYLKAPLDKFFGSFWKRWAERNEAARAKQIELIERIKDDRDALFATTFLATTMQWVSLLLLVAIGFLVSHFKIEGSEWFKYFSIALVVTMGVVFLNVLRLTLDLISALVAAQKHLFRKK
jgi:hypothetical protein